MLVNHFILKLNMDSDLSTDQTQIHEVNATSTMSTVVLNGSIFNILPMTGDGDKQVLVPDKFDVSAASSLSAENVFSVDDSKGKIFSLSENSFTNVQVSELSLGPVNHGLDIATSTVPTQLLQHDPITESGDSTHTSFIQIIQASDIDEDDTEPVSITSSVLPSIASPDDSNDADLGDELTGATILAVTGGNLDVLPVSSGLPILTTAQFTAPTVHVTQIEALPQPQPKKRGGWPKGKRRKEVKSISIPKPPMTGYVIYVNEHRARVKEANPELTFPAISKVLGAEWSALDIVEKQKYLDMAEEDKARYKEELSVYQASEDYMAYLAKRKTQSGGIGAVHPAEDDYAAGDMDNDMLYCKVCDQYFSSMHNRKEHFYGNKHLNNVANAVEKMGKEEESLAAAAAAAAAENATELSLSAFAAGGDEDAQKSEPLDMERCFLQIMEKNHDREVELVHLRKQLQEQQALNISLVGTIKEYQEKHQKYEQDIANAKAYGSALLTQINTLRMVPTLFGVINF